MQKKDLQKKKRAENKDKKVEFKFRVSLFLYQLPIHILVIGSVFMVALILDKFIEAISFLIAFFILRYKYDTTYHHDKVWCCLCLTIGMFIASVALSLPIHVSLFSSIFFAFIDTFILWYIKHVKDIKMELHKLKNKTIWTMTDDELINYCKCVGIKNERIDFVLMVTKGYSFGQIADRLGYSVPTLKDWSKICKLKLKIPSWNP